MIYISVDVSGSAGDLYCYDAGTAIRVGSGISFYKGAYSI